MQNFIKHLLKSSAIVKIMLKMYFILKHFNLKNGVYVYALYFNSILLEICMGYIKMYIFYF